MTKRKLMYLQDLLSRYAKAIVARDKRLQKNIENRVKAGFKVKSIPEAYQIFKAERKALRIVGK